MSDMAEEFSPRPAPAARQMRLFYDPASYSAFPHVIRMEGDELLVAFRQAPKVEGIRHTHPRSIITLIRSYDLGESWQVDAASQMGAGGGQELGLIYLGDGNVGGALAAHEVVHWHETERIAFRDPPRKEYPYIGGSPDTSIRPVRVQQRGCAVVLERQLRADLAPGARHPGRRQGAGMRAAGAHRGRHAADPGLRLARRREPLLVGAVPLTRSAPPGRRGR